MSAAGGSRGALPHLAGLGRRLLREPLVHFALLGGLLLAADHARTPPHPAGEGRRIVVTQRQVEELRRDLVQRRGHAPTADEEKQEIDRYIEEEELFRAAVGLGLHESDTIVRRRLVQRMRFLHEDMAPVREPSDDELRAYVADHTDRYAPEPRISFDHVFFARSKHGAALQASAVEALAALDRGADVASDPFPLPLRTAAETRNDLARALGPALADELFTLPAGVWRGPLVSSYGLHLVRVRERAQGGLDFATARRQAREDWLADRKHAVERALMASLRDGFEIVREDAAGAGR